MNSYIKFLFKVGTEKKLFKGIFIAFNKYQT